MRDIADKIDNISVLSAVEFNASIMRELENSVTDTGIVLDPTGGPDTDSHMLAQAMSRASQGAQTYQDSGTANTYDLTAVGTFRQPTVYFDGMTVTFLVGNTNTGISTINVSSIGVVNLKSSTGTDLTAGDVLENTYVSVTYNATSTEFRLVTRPQQAIPTGDELPIGSVYMNTSSSTNPATLLGYGTWVAIQDRMVIGAGGSYSAGSTGGSATTSISESNLPSSLGVTVNRGDSGIGDGSGDSFRMSTLPNHGTSTTTLSSVGSGSALNTISPYYGAYIWRRTA